MSFRYIKVKTKGQIEGEKLLVPKLRFKEFKDEWKEISLVNVFTFYNTNSLSRADLSEEGLIKNIHYGDIHQKFNNILDVNKEKLPYIKSDIKVNIHNEENYCQDGDLILADASEDYDGIGKAVEVINVGNNIIVSGLHTILARDTNKVMSLGFKGYLFNTPLIHNQIRVLANGFKVYGISKNNIYDLDVRIPTKTEQEKITNFLILLDKKIELQQRRIEALKIYKRRLIKKIFDDIKDNDSIRLKDLYHFAYGEGNTNPDNGGIYPVYGANGKIGGFNKYNAEYSVIIGHMGAYAGNVLFEENKHFVTYNGTIAIPKNIKILRPKFGYYMLLNTNLPRICAGSGMPFLSYEILNNIKVKLPDIKAQEKCEKVLDKTEAKIKLEKRKFKNLSQLKKSLLQQMFI